MTASCAVIADAGEQIMLSAYDGHIALAVVDLDPLAALSLGADLIDAALRHIIRTASAKTCKPTRGGDPHADARKERDTALRELALLLAPGRPAENQARVVSDRLSRYKPHLSETAPERQLMAKVMATGLEVPTIERLRRILVRRKK